MKKFRIRHNFNAHQPEWTPALTQRYGLNNEGYIVEATSKEAAKNLLLLKYNINPFYVTITEV